MGTWENSATNRSSCSTQLARAAEASEATLPCTATWASTTRRSLVLPTSSTKPSATTSTCQRPMEALTTTARFSTCALVIGGCSASWSLAATAPRMAAETTAATTMTRQPLGRRLWRRLATKLHATTVNFLPHETCDDLPESAFDLL